MSESNDNQGQELLTTIYREIGETKTAVQNLDSKLDNHINYSLKELKKINDLDAEQNRILDTHIEGVNTLKEMHASHREETKEQINILKESLNLQKEEHDKRIRAIEKPVNSAKTIGKLIGWMAGVAGGLATATWVVLQLVGS